MIASQTELLKGIVSLYLDYTELQAERQILMSMDDLYGQHGAAFPY